MKDVASQSDDRFQRLPIYSIAFAWGLAEATLFFIVPDVLLSAIGCRSIKSGIKAALAAVGGALVGGGIMYSAAGYFPQNIHDLLLNVPAIHEDLIAKVDSQVSSHGVVAAFIGPAEGIPYKIYAYHWGRRHENLLVFLLITIPARGIRFLLAVVLANAIARSLKRWTKRRILPEIVILLLFWIVFYVFYFLHFSR